MGRGRTAERERSRLTAEATLIFLHIGKTGGMSLRRVLRRNFRRSDVLDLGGRGMPREDTLRAFARLPEAERGRPRLIEGHTVFGLHELVPRPCLYVTMLRDPDRLAVSQYRFVLRTPGHRFHRRVVEERMTLEEYIRSGMSPEMDNGQTRAIAGDVSTPYGECGPSMLAAAKRNLERHFPFVGLTERFDESLVLLGRTFGWRRIHYVPENVAPPGERPELTEGGRRLIREHTALDRELYEFALRRLESAVAGDPTFPEDLARFRRRNALYLPWGYVTFGVPHQAYRLLVRHGLVSGRRPRVT